MKRIIVKKSKIHGKGVFTTRNFRKGEIVIKWKKIRLIPKNDIKKLSKKDKKYLSYFGKDKYILHGIPEKYVNHSCEANTKVSVNKKVDVAVRNIKKGEEITADYSSEKIPGLNIKCKCGSIKCRKIIKNEK